MTAVAFARVQSRRFGVMANEQIRASAASIEGSSARRPRDGRARLHTLFRHSEIDAGTAVLNLALPWGSAARISAPYISFKTALAERIRGDF
jgi:hypothetical protein